MVKTPRLIDSCGLINPLCFQSTSRVMIRHRVQDNYDRKNERDHQTAAHRLMVINSAALLFAALLRRFVRVLVHRHTVFLGTLIDTNLR